MFEQLTELVKQFGGDAVVNNAAVPNEHNEAVLGEASSSILDGLKKIATQGNGAELIGGLFNGNSAGDTSNPVVKMLTEQLSGSLGQKFGLGSEAASGVAASLIPKVLGSLIGGAKDPNNAGIQITDVIGAISGGNSGGIMDVVSKFGGQFGLDQNGDGKVDMSDALAAATKQGGLGGMLGGLFGKS
ncbi:hypothetical protein B0A58_12800 [Flavobacterium branchiophilum NBRC 15030 = ATCC 35035]|uniref:DUF937 domain-containing protein n=2 Tax=Flavobacterium branchiophilum TaxID=55197 RepID=G2Z0Y0_FLABF|nr:hypothetical protein [Flavobacterium branchiophilum]OXA72287.1 hypothetical protein B0A58_12800 [Flavobacterium branchiophilum NBRC 15030 = ATCC 35035]TQM41964.1 hypothetical protein BC670_2982 [Flavobacterium branchiophilum]GEM55062.1 hypothetical protein FB1_12830 [Flavobacterium branchiophilum NBRC 15030 = ATCC 35035]CCB69526.1 Protein of unknown function [Flavobacterium branchiophilum FL-15]